MRHSVLVPHRDRNEHLALCLWSLERSARSCGVSHWEAVVVDCGSREIPREGPDVRVVCDRDHPRTFNKSRALNIAIRESDGGILTFLDADAVVGPRFLEAAGCLAEGIDRCCYRVRYLPMTEAARIHAAEDRDAYVDELFGDYGSYRMAMEAYRRHYLDVRRHPGISGEPWGNSQFSILRERLGDVRFDEEIGFGIEDVDVNMQLEAMLGASYRGRIFTEGERAMFHLEHPPSPWRERNFLSQRARMHKLKRKKLLGY